MSKTSKYKCNKCDNCFWYWSGSYDKICHNQMVTSLNTKNRYEDDCAFFEDKFIGNDKARDVTEDYYDGRW